MRISTLSLIFSLVLAFIPGTIAAIICDIGAVESIGVPDPVLDYGDAPSPYPTLLEDDGVNFLDPFEPNSATTVEVTVSENANIEMWWDFNHDGIWDDPGEQQPPEQGINAGITSFKINVPSDAPTGDTYVRVRVMSNVSDPTGFIPDGEVEDYRITIVEPLFVRAFPGEQIIRTLGLPSPKARLKI